MNLTILVWLPLAAVIAGFVLPSTEARFAALLGSGATLVLAVVLLFRFDGGQQGLQFVIDKTWISQLGIHYKLGVDGLNLFLIALAALLFFASVAWSALREWDRPHLFYLWFGLAESGVLGALMAQDLALFVIFFDVMLVPFLFLGGGWGSTPNRVREHGQALHLHARRLPADALGRGRHRRARARRHRHLRPRPAGLQRAAAADRARRSGSSSSSPRPSWSRCRPSRCTAGCPTGTRRCRCRCWPSSRGSSPRSRAYGFLRVVLPVYPDASAHFQELMLLISLASILYGSALAFTTPDARLILGYSSVAQLGFITLGIFSLQDTGAQGALLQAFNHGLVVAPAFFIVALLAARAAARKTSATWAASPSARPSSPPCS